MSRLWRSKVLAKVDSGCAHGVPVRVWGFYELKDRGALEIGLSTDKHLLLKLKTEMRLESKFMMPLKSKTERSQTLNFSRGLIQSL